MVFRGLLALFHYCLFFFTVCQIIKMMMMTIMRITMMLFTTYTSPLVVNVPLKASIDIQSQGIRPWLFKQNKCYFSKCVTWLIGFSPSYAIDIKHKQLCRAKRGYKYKKKERKRNLYYKKSYRVGEFRLKETNNWNRRKKKTKTKTKNRKKQQREKQSSTPASLEARNLCPTDATKRILLMK